MFKRIDHVEIVPSSLERTLRFYTDLLGFEVAERHRVEAPPLREAVFIRLNDSVIELLDIEDPAPPSAHPWQVGYRLIAIEVKDMKEALASLEDKGVKIAWGPVSIGGSKLAEIRDPDGLPIQLIQR